MIGIGHRQEKYTKIKLLAEKSKQYNAKYDDLISKGVSPNEATTTLQKEESEKRHQGTFVEEPYKITSQINQIGGAVHLGYAQKTLSETQNFYAPMESVMQGKKTGTATNFKITKTEDEKHEMTKMKQRIQKDHLQEDAEIDLGEPISTDYKRNFNDDEKMKDMRANKDMKFHQQKNQLKWYKETYIKTKDSLRKC